MLLLLLLLRCLHRLVAPIVLRQTSQRLRLRLLLHLLLRLVVCTPLLPLQLIFVLSHLLQLFMLFALLYGMFCWLWQPADGHWLPEPLGLQEICRIQVKAQKKDQQQTQQHVTCWLITYDKVLQSSTCCMQHKAEHQEHTVSRGVLVCTVAVHACATIMLTFVSLEYIRVPQLPMQLCLLPRNSRQLLIVLLLSNRCCCLFHLICFCHWPMPQPSLAYSCCCTVCPVTWPKLA